MTALLRYASGLCMLSTTVLLALVFSESATHGFIAATIGLLCYAAGLISALLRPESEIPNEAWDRHLEIVREIGHEPPRPHGRWTIGPNEIRGEKR